MSEYTYAHRLALVAWHDAFQEPGIMAAAELKELHPSGLLFLSFGLLVDDSGDSILLAKDWIVPMDLVRNTTRIRKCDIVSMHTAKILLNPLDDEHGVELLSIPELTPIMSQFRNGQDNKVYGIVMQDEHWRAA